MPEAWLISRICEEFGCLPSDAIYEPLPLVVEIMDLRAYRRAKADLDRWEADERPATQKGRPPAGPLVEAVRANRTALIREMAAEGRRRKERGMAGRGERAGR